MKWEPFRVLLLNKSVCCVMYASVYILKSVVYVWEHKGDMSRIIAPSFKWCVQAIAFDGVVYSVSKYIIKRFFFIFFIAENRSDNKTRSLCTAVLVPFNGAFIYSVTVSCLLHLYVLVLALCLCLCWWYNCDLAGGDCVCDVNNLLRCVASVFRSHLVYTVGWFPSTRSPKKNIFFLSS